MSPVARLRGSNDITEFVPLGEDVDKIVGVNKHRRIIYGMCTSAVLAGPDLHHSKQIGPARAEVGGRLYLIGMFPRALGTPWFESLAFDDDRRRREDEWSLNLLPSPPFMDLPYKRTCMVDSYDGAGGASTERTTRVSTRWDGTYAFDTARGSWREEGDWALPFLGRAQYVPDYGLWFGFSDKARYDLCSADLVAASPGSARPVYRHV